MPGVDIYYRHGVMDTEVASAIKAAVREHGADTFSTSEIQLGEGDFSFKFYPPEKFDELTNDIIVRIRLHHFPERIKDDPDALPQGIALLLGVALSQVEEFDPTRTIGVEILICEIGWGTATPMKAKIADRLSARTILRRPGRAQISGEGLED